MNNSKIKFLFYSIGLFFLLIGCEDKITEERIYTANVPVYMSYDELRSAVQVQSPIELENPGKMYFKDNYIFISEQLAGVHIIDNSNPSAPQNVAFINIPGNTEVAVFGNYLYVDSYVDLVVMDISSPGNATEVKRIENIFPYSTPSPDSDYPVAQLEPIKGVVTSWKIEEINETTEHTVSHFYYYEAYDMAVARETSGMSNQNTVVPNNSGSSTGIAGSMSRFIISKEHLYTVEESTMHVFDLANPNNPAEGTTIDITNLDWNSIVETIFPYNDYIFVGTQSGMLVYDISIPGTPVFTSEFSHITSCDPVVVENDTAYVTLRGGSACGSFNNQLDVIDVSNISSPELVKSYALTSPYGLGIDDDVLFICDGDDGLKVYDVSDKLNIDQHMINNFSNINAFDVIPLGNVLLMIGEDGLYQYDYSDLNNLVLLSSIPVN